ncbi:MAG: class I SAM-dependent methyltransferase [Pseudomonadota bacterium]
MLALTEPIKANLLQPLWLLKKSGEVGLPPQIRAALRATAWGRDTADERQSMAAIEAVRQTLERSDRVIQFVDYGAGNPAETLGDGEAEGGVTSDRRLGDLARVASKPPFWGRFLFHIVRHCQPKGCIEMGTCVGLSAAYIASALKLNKSGRLMTLEGAPALADIARDTLGQLDLTCAEVRTGRFSVTLDPALEAMAPVDFAFIDGHHDEVATLNYLEQIKPHLADDAVLVFDDIAWSDGMRRAWRRIAAAYASVELRNVGLVIFRQTTQGSAASDRH